MTKNVFQEAGEEALETVFKIIEELKAEFGLPVGYESANAKEQQEFFDTLTPEMEQMYLQQYGPLAMNRMRIAEMRRRGSLSKTRKGR